MILEALYRLADHEGLTSDPDYEQKPVAWLVRVGKGGKLIAIEGTHYTPEAQGRAKPRPQAKNLRVPRQPIRTSGDRAFFLCDKAEYALGLDPETDAKKRRAPERVLARFSLFCGEVDACLAATHDEGVQAVSDLLSHIRSGSERVALQEECGSSDLFAFVYAPDVDRMVHERQAVRDYWRKAREAGASKDGELQCLITGEPVGDPENFPLLKKLPGGTPSGVSLVSFNKPAFESHGWRGNANAPVSRPAAEAASTALNRLLHPAFPDPRPETLGQPLPRRNFRIGADTAVCFWASDRRSDEFLDSMAALLNPDDPAQVGEMYRSLWRGKPIQMNDTSRFYALTLTGTQGRAVVRDWFESSVADVNANLARYFRDLDIVLNSRPRGEKQAPAHLRLDSLMESLAPLGKPEGVPAPLATAFVSSALRGSMFPLAILQKAVERFRAEIGRSQGADSVRRDARVALIKAVLCRNTKHTELTSAMDPQNRRPGYLLGRLMAVLERLQQVALGDVNATLVDRFFGAASAAPQSVFPRLLKNARHHARKATDDPRSRGAASWLEQEIDGIVSGMGVQQHRQGVPYTGFPRHLHLEEQGLFVLGYHHQRHWLWMSKEERQQWREEHASTLS